MQFRNQVPKLLAFAVTMALASGALADEHRHFPVVVHSVGHPVDSRGVVWGHGDIHHFHDFDYGAWRGGYWRHDWHNNHFGWWWIVGGAWVFYSVPVYPYPDPYVPSTVIVQQAAPTDAPPDGAPAPAFWYYCASAQNYYPYVTQCPVGWEQVAATPAAPVQAAPPPPPPGNPPAPPPAGSAPATTPPPTDADSTW